MHLYYKAEVSDSHGAPGLNLGPGAPREAGLALARRGGCGCCGHQGNEGSRDSSEGSKRTRGGNLTDKASEARGP